MMLEAAMMKHAVVTNSCRAGLAFEVQQAGSDLECWGERQPLPLAHHPDSAMLLFSPAADRLHVRPGVSESVRPASRLQETLQAHMLTVHAACALQPQGCPSRSLAPSS